MSNSNDKKTSRREFIGKLLSGGALLQTGAWSSLVGILSSIPAEKAEAQIHTHSFWKKKATGGWYAFGQNSFGAFGDGTTTTNALGKLVGTNSWSQIVAGDQFTVGLRSDGTMWGSGKAANYGMLGQSNKTNRSAWVQIGTGKSFTQVGASVDSAFGIATDGKLWIWGNNSSYKLATGTSTSVSSPVQVLGTNSWKQVSSSYNATIAIRTDGLMFSSGDNSVNYELGIGDVGGTGRRSSFVQIGTKSWSEISSGTGYTLAIDTTGGISGWGSSDYHQAGSGPANGYPGPITPTQFATGFSKVSAGALHALGIKTDGTLWSWGLNSFGQLGTLGLVTYSPTQLPGTWNKLAKATLYGGTGAIKTSGGASTWGYNDEGALGIGSRSYKLSPVQVSGAGSGYTDIIFGGYHSFGINALGQLWAVGLNNWGQLGNSAFTNRSTPVQVAGSWAQVAGGFYHSAGIRSDGTLWTWGANSVGELANSVAVGYDSSNCTSSPVQVTGGGSWSQVSLGAYHTGAISSTGGIYLSGLNYYGQLANGTFNDLTSLTQVGTASWTQISCGPYNTLAIQTDGSLWAVGLNDNGQLGLGNTNIRNTFAKVGTQSWLQVSAGGYHSAGIRSDGTLWVWGDNSRGQLGTDAVVSSLTPRQVNGSWVQVLASYDNTFALKADGTIWCWGGNMCGSLGLNVDHITPKAIPGSWVQAFAGFNFSVALRNDNTLWAWGINIYGQLGQGDAVTRFSPVQISGTWESIVAGSAAGDFFFAKKS